ncbi:E3 ubiquitin-protein ligase XBOS34 [Phytophthora cinnamomi]|uniref:E3 ubiquitin-protein ligase XBOS34 n=1 Tax=Phytophthora cinnamomi TaxID=4785 RepID=UPI003559AF21|nr:E3 ubiquitin-protein ligase XBOS34 [Phytophthora cinnamomi]
MSLDDVQTLHYVFAADSLNNLAQWRRVLQNSNFYSRESRSSLYRTSLFETQNGELYYWPHELVENLRSSILREQEQQQEEANDLLYQRLRTTFEQRQPDGIQDAPHEPAPGPAQAQAQSRPSQPDDEESIDELPPNFQRRPTPVRRPDMSRVADSREPSRVHFTPQQPVKYVEVPLAAQRPYIDGHQTNSSVSIVSGSELDTAGPEFATGVLLVTDDGSQASQPQQSSNQEPQHENDSNNDSASEEERPQPSEAQGPQSSSATQTVVVLVLGPMLTLHFYPETSFHRLGFYTAILSGSGLPGPR